MYMSVCESAGALTCVYVACFALVWFIGGMNLGVLSYKTRIISFSEKGLCL